VSIFDWLFGCNTTAHDDGSTTEHYKSGTVVNKDADGHIKEVVTEERSGPFGLFGPIEKVTRDGDGNIINTQPISEDKDES
jgi:hypothetical protein